MKAANDAASAASSTTNGYLTSIVPTSYIDSMPHSTQSAFNHVTTTDQSGLQRRLSDIGGFQDGLLLIFRFFIISLNSRWFTIDFKASLNFISFLQIQNDLNRFYVSAFYYNIG